MSAANLSTTDKLLKRVYGPAVREQLFEEVAIWNVMDQRSQVETEGEKITEVLHVGRNQGIGSRSDDEFLPEAGNQRHIQVDINMTSTYIVGEVSARSARSMDTTKAAYESSIKNEMKGSVNDFTNDMARMVVSGDGVLCTVNGALTAGATTFVASDLINLGIGQKIVIYNGATEQSNAYTAGNPSTGGHVITAITKSTKTVTVTPAITGAVTNGAAVYRAGNFNGTTVKEPNGLGTIIATTGTYYGQNRATEYELQSQTLSITGAADADLEDKLQEAADLVAGEAGTSNDIYFSDFKSRRRILKANQANKRYHIGENYPTLRSGVKLGNDLRAGIEEGVRINGRPLIASRRMPLGVIYGLCTDEWVALQQSDVEWVTNDSGGVLHSMLVGGNKDAYKFSAYKDYQIFCRKPKAQLKITGADA